MLIELHIIQSFVPSNLNRDDLNQPKECQFGGVRRARISSQCIKRAIRTHPIFTQATQVPIGTRTRYIVRKLTERLVEEGLLGGDTAKIGKVVEDFVKAYGKKKDKEIKIDEEKRTDVLLYVSQSELNDIVTLLKGKLTDLTDPPKTGEAYNPIVERLIKDYGEKTSAPDIALFGRMVATKPELNLNAACQVAHAISTHEVKVEDDYWTAVDDLQPEEQTGAGMLDYLGFNSACYYRYACVDWRQLHQNLAADYDLARRTVEGFLRASALAIPTGKRTAFAQNCEPAFLMAVVRQDGLAWNLANAFERPVTPQREGGVEGGFIAPSVKALEAHWSRLCRKFGQESLRQVSVWVADDALPLGSLSRNAYDRFDDWVASVVAALPDAEE